MIVPALSVALALFLAPVHAKDEPEWKHATIVFAKHKLAEDSNVAGNGSAVGQAAHEQFDLDAGEVTYSVEQWVVPNRMLRLAEGDRVEFAIINSKTMLLKSGTGKPRKMKIVATYPKRRSMVTPE